MIDIFPGEYYNTIEYSNKIRHEKNVDPMRIEVVINVHLPNLNKISSRYVF